MKKLILLLLLVIISGFVVAESGTYTDGPFKGLRYTESDFNTRTIFDNVTNHTTHINHKEVYVFESHPNLDDEPLNMIEKVNFEYWNNLSEEEENLTVIIDDVNVTYTYTVPVEGGFWDAILDYEDSNYYFEIIVVVLAIFIVFATWRFVVLRKKSKPRSPEQTVLDMLDRGYSPQEVAKWYKKNQEGDEER